jgi:hypothetical protein
MTAPRPRWPWRRLILLTATALPVLLLATAASYLLIRYLQARDDLGTYTLTVLDDHGATVGHGRLDLVAESWTARWSLPGDSTRLPLVTFTPTLRGHAGTLVVADWAMWDPTEPHHAAFTETAFTLEDPHTIFETGIEVTATAPWGQTSVAYLPLNPGPTASAWNFVPRTCQHAVPCTITVARAHP